MKTLRTSIFSGRFAPGERLVEAELSRELGISRGPIREALALLENEGIVINVPRKGKFVQGFDDRLIDEVYSLRRVLEQYAVERIMGSLTEAMRQALEDSLTLVREAADAQDLVLLAERDIVFHSTLYELADHELLKRAWVEDVAGKLRLLLNITTRTHLALLDTAANHESIVIALVSGDVEHARALVSDHIDDGWRRAKSALDDRYPSTSP